MLGFFTVRFCFAGKENIHDIRRYITMLMVAFNYAYLSFSDTIIENVCTCTWVLFMSTLYLGNFKTSEPVPVPGQRISTCTFTWVPLPVSDPNPGSWVWEYSP